MPLEVSSVSSVEELRQLTTLQLNAFLRVPVIRTIYPQGITPAIQSTTEARYIKSWETDPSSKFFRVVDTSSRHNIAFAIWRLFLTPEDESQRSDLGARQASQDVKADVADDFWIGIVRARKLMAGRAHCFLAILATDTEHHRRGAGAMLVKWGVDQADEKGLPCFLESSPDGLALYKKYGFRDVGGLMIDLGNEEGVRDGTNMYRHVVMYRNSKKGRDDEAEWLVKALEAGDQRPL